jgi:hypothetical protein
VDNKRVLLVLPDVGTQLGRRPEGHPDGSAEALSHGLNQASRCWCEYGKPL